MPIAAVNSVQHAYVAKNMWFKMFFKATLIGTVWSGIIGIIMAYTGFGVWLCSTLVMPFSIQFRCGFFAKWRPKWMFSFSRLKAIYDYGWKILAVGLVDTLFGQIRSLVIAKQYSRADLAYYNRGVFFPSFSMRLIEPTISQRIIPSIIQLQR